MAAIPVKNRIIITMMGVSKMLDWPICNSDSDLFYQIPHRLVEILGDGSSPVIGIECGKSTIKTIIFDNFRKLSPEQYFLRWFIQILLSIQLRYEAFVLKDGIIIENPAFNQQTKGIPDPFFIGICKVRVLLAYLNGSTEKGIFE
jgi:hypothetical protein